MDTTSIAGQPSQVPHRTRTSIWDIPVWSVVVVLAFIVALAMSTFFVGDTGVYNDDYFLNQRDPATGKIESLIMNRPWHLWRPVTRVVLPGLVTTLWHTPWVLHLISAGLHAAVVGLAYGLLRRVRVSAGIAACGAMLFMLYPAHFEAVLWIAIICTLLSTVLVLGIWHLYAWWLERGHEAPVGTRLWALAAMGGSAWVAAAMNEQPPGVLAALPMLVMILGGAKGASFAERARRTLLPVAVVGLALVIYLIGFFKHKMNLAPVDVPESATLHLAQLAAKIPMELALVNFGRGALTEGLASVAARPLLAAAGFGLLGVVGLIWVARSGVQSHDRASGATAPRMGWIIALGACWTVLAWLPVAAAHSVTSPRLHYVPLLGLVLVICGVLAWVTPFVVNLQHAARGVIVGASRLAFCGVLAAFVLMWIGICKNLQLRYQADEAERQALAAAVGPNIEDGTLLVPVRVNSVTARTGSDRFDGYFRHSWFWQFAAGWSVRIALHRGDVYTYQTMSGVSEGGVAHEMLWLSDEDPLRWVVIRSSLAPPKPPRHWQEIPKSKLTHARLLPLDRCVFFEVTEPGKVQVFTVVRLHGPWENAGEPGGGKPIDLFPRQTALMQRGRQPALPGRCLDLYTMPDDVRKAFARDDEHATHRTATSAQR